LSFKHSIKTKATASNVCLFITIHTVFVCVDSNSPNSVKGEGKGNVHPIAGHEGPEGE